MKNYIIAINGEKANMVTNPRKVVDQELYRAARTDAYATYVSEKINQEEDGEEFILNDEENENHIDYQTNEEIFYDDDFSL